jgi:hypothetical protein
MEESPFWDASSRSDSQEIPRLLLNLKVHYPVQLVPILSQMNPTTLFPQHPFRYYFPIYA